MKIQLNKLLWIIAVLLAVLFSVPAALNTYMPFYIVQSSSMLPAYSVGGVVLVHHYVPRDTHALIGKGIVFYAYPTGKVIVHRVKAVDGKYLVTKGDHNDSEDQFEPAAADILGIVWGYLPLVLTHS